LGDFPGPGSLLASINPGSGTDDPGNQFVAGIASYGTDSSQLIQLYNGVVNVGQAPGTQIVLNPGADITFNITTAIAGVLNAASEFTSNDNSEVLPGFLGAGVLNSGSAAKMSTIMTSPIGANDAACIVVQSENDGGTDAPIVSLGTVSTPDDITLIYSPLLVELEPLFACNLKCAGCGKIQHPASVLKQRMPVEQAVAAIEESGAPMVSIAGGEPLMHPQIEVIVDELIKRKKMVFLCTNAVLLPKHLHKFKPSPYFRWVVHIDGLRERHDESVSKEGVFDQAVAAIKLAQAKGFKVNTNTTFFNTDTPQTVIDVLNYLNDDLGVDDLQISPGYAYEKAPDQEHFLGVEETREMFRKAFADGRRKKWRLMHTPLFLDFLEGKVEYECTAWSIPSYSLFGWQKPCYLMSDGYVSSYKELIETTEWEKYGRGKDPRCANCMAHCGYEPSAVIATMSSLKEGIRALRES
ncbi:MAG: adenosyl-hopene transferase HpnH, partial [Trebonia sp.]